MDTKQPQSLGSPACRLHVYTTVGRRDESNGPILVPSNAAPVARVGETFIDEEAFAFVTHPIF